MRGATVRDRKSLSTSNCKIVITYIFEMIRKIVEIWCHMIGSSYVCEPSGFSLFSSSHSLKFLTWLLPLGREIQPIEIVKGRVAYAITDLTCGRRELWTLMWSGWSGRATSRVRVTATATTTTTVSRPPTGAKSSTKSRCVQRSDVSCKGRKWNYATLTLVQM